MRNVLLRLSVTLGTISTILTACTKDVERMKMTKSSSTTQPSKILEASKQNAEDLGVQIKYLSAINDQKKFIEESTIFMADFHQYYKLTDSMYLPWSSYFLAVRKFLLEKNNKELPIAKKEIYEKILIPHFGNFYNDLNGFDWRILRNIIDFDFFPKDSDLELSKKVLLKKFLAQIFLAQEYLTWQKEGKDINIFANKILLNLQQECEKGSPTILNAVVCGRFDKKLFSFLPGTLILGNMGGLYLLINTVTNDTRDILKDIIGEKYFEKTSVDGNEDKKIIGEGAFGKVRFALSLFNAKSKPGRIVCIKKTKFVDEVDQKGNLVEGSTIVCNTINNYFIGEAAKIIRAPVVLDNVIILSEQVKDIHRKGYVMLELLPKNSGEAIFCSDKKSDYNTWEYQKPYMLSVLNKMLELIKNNIVMADLKPENTLYDVDRRRADIIDLGGAVKINNIHWEEFMSTKYGIPEHTEGFCSHEFSRLRDEDIESIDMKKSLVYTCGMVLKRITENGSDIEQGFLEKLIVQTIAHDPKSRLSIEELLYEIDKISTPASREWDEIGSLVQYKNAVSEVLCKNKGAIAINQDMEDPDFYIPLMVTTKDPNRYKKLSLTKLESEIKNFLFDNSPCQIMLLLGEAGSGKSIALQRVFMDQINKWKFGNPLPIYLNLAYSIDITESIKNLDDILQTNIFSQLPSTEINLFLDSFDEGIYATQQEKVTLIDSYINHEMFGKKFGKNLKLLITCRTNFLAGDDDDKWFYPHQDPTGFKKFYITPINYDEEANFLPFVERWSEVQMKKEKNMKEDKFDFSPEELNKQISELGFSERIDTGYLLYMTLDAMDILRKNKAQISLKDIHAVHNVYIQDYIKKGMKHLTENQRKILENCFDKKVDFESNINYLAKFLARWLHFKSQFIIREDAPLFDKKAYNYEPYTRMEDQKIFYLLKLLPLKVNVATVGTYYESAQQISIAFKHDIIKYYYLAEAIEDDFQNE